jgi:hypothetical protein
MITYGPYINEAITQIGSGEQNFRKPHLDLLDDLKSDLKSIGHHDVMYRGFSGAAFISLITANDRDKFMGGGANKVVPRTIMADLGIKHPLFASFSDYIAKFFGHVFICVPQKPFKVWQSTEVDDLGVLNDKIEYNIKEIGGVVIKSESDKNSVEYQIQKAHEYAKTYKNTLARVTDGEIIIDASSYWLIDLPLLIKRAGKYAPPGPYKTYSDLIGLVESFEKFMAWKIQKSGIDLGARETEIQTKEDAIADATEKITNLVHDFHFDANYDKMYNAKNSKIIDGIEKQFDIFDKFKIVKRLPALDNEITDTMKDFEIRPLAFKVLDLIKLYKSKEWDQDKEDEDIEKSHAWAAKNPRVLNAAAMLNRHGKRGPKAEAEWKWNQLMIKKNRAGEL